MTLSVINNLVKTTEVSLAHVTHFSLSVAVTAQGMCLIVSVHPIGVMKHDILCLLMHIPLTMTCQPVYIWLDSPQLCLVGGV